MKKYLFLILVLSVIYTNIKSQEYKSTIVDKYLLDFSIPDIPAFSALGTNPSDVLRPSDIKKFAVMMQPFYSDGSFILPKSFAIEVAPWKFALNDLTLSDYQTNLCKRLLYNTSVSLGTNRLNDSIGTTNASLGVRITIAGKNSDILQNEDFLKKAFQNQAAKLDAFQKDWDKYAKENDIDVGDDDFDERKELFIQTMFKFDEAFSITSVLNEFNEENWNKGRLDFAAAVLGQSSDSFVKNIGYQSFDIWASWNIGPFWNLSKNNHTQFLLGGHYKQNKLFENQTLRDYTGNLNFRWYEGTKDFRGFLEAQYKNERKLEIVESSLLFNLGSEFRISDDFWVVFSGGIENLLDSGKSRFVTNLDFRYAFNKKN